MSYELNEPGTTSDAEDTRQAKQRYTIVEKLDVGGMAEIFIAQSTSVGGIQKRVAIKRILPNLTKNQRFVNMFLDEARLCMYLNHANIVQVFDVGKADGTYFIVMEYVEGTNLRQIFQQVSETGHQLAVEFAVYILAEVCKGMAHAHESTDPDGNPLSLVHRDISPPNILISKSGEVKITDFGLAKAQTQIELTDPGVVKGKFSYLSPEAANGKIVDHRADLFSAGIVLWEILANRRLFLGKSDLETVELIRDAKVPPLSLFNEHVPDSLQKIVDRALSRDLKHRFQSAQDMANELVQFLVDNSLKATNFGLAEMVRQINDPESASRGRPLQRIGELIDDELDKLKQLNQDPDNMNEPGSQPLNDTEVSSADDAYLLEIVDMWGGHEDLEPIVDTHLADMLEAYAKAPNNVSNSRGSDTASMGRLPLIIALTLAALITAGATYGALVLFGVM
ncbi:MAG TPA: serine/threonine protein kinase [Myxococcales bacterium]|nr:serine/threonine protein kinase [Myxococcales bacterium]